MICDVGQSQKVANGIWEPQVEMMSGIGRGGRCGRLCAGRTVQMRWDVLSQRWVSQGPCVLSLNEERAWFTFLGK